MGEKSGCFALDDGLDDKAYQEHRKGDCTVQQTVGIPGEGRDGVHVGSENDKIYVVRHGTENSDTDGSNHDCVQRANPLLGTPSIFGAVPFADEIQDKEFIADENKLGFEKFSLHFDGENGGELRYTNKSGAKVLPFKMCENAFATFPEEGYSDGMGGVRTKGFFYKCASSAAWREEKKLQIRVRIIDRYFGNLCMIFSFKNPSLAVVTMVKTAEDFLNEYQGEFLARAK